MFHVQRLATDAVDEVPRAVVRQVQDPQSKKAIKGSRFALLRSQWNLSSDDKVKLSEIQRANRSLYRA